MKAKALRAIHLLAIIALLVLVTRKSTAEKALRAKYREWVEEGERIHVRSWYAEAETALTDEWNLDCLLYTSPSPRDRTRSRMPSSA